MLLDDDLIDSFDMRWIIGSSYEFIGRTFTVIFPGVVRYRPSREIGFCS